MPIPWLHPNILEFPNPEHTESYGIVAAGGDMSPQRVIEAYKKGIFPWYNIDTEPILWWCPDPRMVLFPDELKVSKSMKKLFNQKKFDVTVNQCFEKVMRSCMHTPREGQDGTWINEDMIATYTTLHKHGFAHSVEVWLGETLVAGLYGISLGRVFFGESMFTYVSNGSKYGFILFVKKLKELGFELIDCQQETPHLTSLGGRVISRSDFLKIVRANEAHPHLLKKYPLSILSYEK